LTFKELCAKIKIKGDFVMEDKLERLLDYMDRETDRYYKLAMDAYENGDILQNQILFGQASVIQKIRWSIEDLIKE
jgi:DNA-binding ferritin-like protein